MSNHFLFILFLVLVEILLMVEGLKEGQMVVQYQTAIQNILVLVLVEGKVERMRINKFIFLCIL